MTENLEIRRKRLIYRSCYTGMKETDLLLGEFARRHVPDFSAAQLDRYERLLESNPDGEIFAWATGRSPVPAAFDNDVMALLRAFRMEQAG